MQGLNQVQGIWNTKPTQEPADREALVASTTLTPRQTDVTVSCATGAPLTVTLPPLITVPHGHMIRIQAVGTVGDEAVVDCHEDNTGVSALAPNSTFAENEYIVVMNFEQRQWIKLIDTSAA